MLDNGYLFEERRLNYLEQGTGSYWIIPVTER